MTDELKACPFCGGDDIDLEFSLDGAGNHQPGCMSCGASGPDTNDQTEKGLSDAWNRRAAPVPPAPAVDAATVERCARVGDKRVQFNRKMRQEYESRGFMNLATEFHHMELESEILTREIRALLNDADMADDVTPLGRDHDPRT